MSNALPTKKELRALAKTAISASEFITNKRIPVEIRDGLNDKDIEKHINRGVGNCVVIEPLLLGKLRDQSGRATIEDVTIAIKIKQNPDRNSTTDYGGAGVDIYDLMDAVRQAMTRHPRHNGGEFFKLASDAWELSSVDEGLFEYAMFFTKETV